ncbi:MAG: uracil-DNA glycosylase [Nitrososphaeria archaeon]
MEDLAREVILCKKCDLWSMGTRAVPGVGPANSPIMIVGEAPGANEEEAGRPFVGRGGKLLRNTLTKFGIKNPYITNVVKHRPPKNRKPKKEEITMCSEFLEYEINAVNPRVILALGRTAIEYFGIMSRLSEANGKVFVVKGRKVIACYHPAAVLRNINLTDEFNRAIEQAKIALTV